MRSCGLLLMVAGATCLLVVSAAWAAEVPPAGPADLHPYVVVADAPPIHVTSLDAAVARRQAVNVDVAGLAEWTGGKGTRLRFDLFDGLSVVGIVDKADRPSKDQLTWSGRLDTEAWGRFTFVLRDGICTAIIRQADHKALYVRPLPDGGHVLDELDEERFDGCGADDALAEGIAPQLRQVTGDRQPATDDGTLFDLMVVYTPAAREGAGGTAAMLVLIDLAVANSNQAFANSEIVPRIRLVHTVEVDYLESGSGGTDLGRLRDPADGYMDEVHTLRDEYGADLVCMINDTMPGLCGLAFVMTEESPAFAASAFSVVRRNCAHATSFVHELGHNMGCLHDRDHASACGFGYVYGYRDPVSVSWRTVMAYSPGSPIPFFSNPDVLYNGQPTGAALDQAKPTCNARTINTTARTVADWRPQAESTIPVETLDEGDALPQTREVAGVVFVDAQAAGNNTGTNWADAFVDLQDALAEAADPAGGISEVWVAAGTYHPDRSTGDRFASFRLVSGVGVYGGFVGGETQREDRDPSTHQTILSGDLWQNDHTGGHPYENSGHVVVAEDVDHTAVLDGFTIAAGYNLNLSWTYDGGGGMAVVNASPTVTRCRFVDNAGPKGGALMIVSGSPTFATCGFHANLSGPIGGAVYNQDGSPLFLSCLFTGNMTTNCELVPTGGAFYSRGRYPRVVNCTFWGNTATMGRSFAAQGDANLTNCILWDDEPVEGVASLSRQIVGSGVELSFSCVRGWTSTMEGVGNHGLDPLFVDPWAANLSGTGGGNWLDDRAQSPALQVIAIRSRYFDDVLPRAVTEDRVTQVVLLAAGYDTRAFRLPFPPTSRVFELDDADTLRLRAHDLRIIRFDRAADHQPRDTRCDTCPILPAEPHALRRQTGQRTGLIPRVQQAVRTGNRLALIQQRLRQRAHPDPADACNMDLRLHATLLHDRLTSGSHDKPSGWRVRSQTASASSVPSQSQTSQSGQGSMRRLAPGQAAAACAVLTITQVKQPAAWLKHAATHSLTVLAATPRQPATTMKNAQGPTTRFAKRPPGVKRPK